MYSKFSVIWDPEATNHISAENHTSKSDLNIFENMNLKGKAETVILRGRVMLDEGEIKAIQGYGRYIPLSPYPVHVYDKIKSRPILGKICLKEDSWDILQIYFKSMCTVF